MFSDFTFAVKCRVRGVILAYKDVETMRRVPSAVDQFFEDKNTALGSGGYHLHLRADAFGDSRYHPALPQRRAHAAAPRREAPYLASLALFLSPQYWYLICRAAFAAALLFVSLYLHASPPSRDTGYIYIYLSFLSLGSCSGGSD